MASSRITPENALHNPKRQTILDYVGAHAGCTFREVVRATGIPTGTARHHLTMLVRMGHLQERPYRATLRFFLPKTEEAKDWQAHVLLRAPQLRRLHAWLLAHPDAMQKEILDAMDGAHGWSRSTTQHRLRRLVDGGLVRELSFGRRRLYTARSPGVRDVHEVHVLQRMHNRLVEA